MKGNLTPAPTSGYNYSQLIASAKEESKYECFAKFISEKIDNYRNNYCYGEAHGCTRSTLAKIIGIDASTLTKIINGSQMTRKRDIVIALCLALRLSPSETNQALNLYPMIPLNRNNLRDLVIEHAICDGLTVSELDAILGQHGFPKLDLIRDKRKKESPSLYYPVNSTTYEEISVNIQPYCIAGNDSTRSLHQRYRPDQYDYRSEMIIRKSDKTDHILRITLDGADYEICKKQEDTWECIYSNIPFCDKYDHIIPCEDADLLNEITKLKEHIDKKARYVHAICADTRNYKRRFDAVNDNGKLVIYGEVFGFDAPELCEYYQIEVSSGNCIFSVSNTSRFMKQYLGKKEWMKIYGNPYSPVTHRFTKQEQISDSRWIAFFQEMLNNARDLLIQLQEHRLFLFNARAWIEIDDLMRIYKVEDEFNCIQTDDLPYEIIPQKDYIIGCDGSPITINDLYRAAELDIYTIEDLCSVRKRYGSLEGFLYIDMLTEQKGTYNG